MGEQAGQGAPPSALSVVPDVGLEGYAHWPSRAPGETVSLMASGCEGRAGFDIVRLVHGDTFPGGPGYLAESQAWGQPAEVELEPRPIDLGSFVRIPYSGSLSPSGDFTLALWILPTSFRGAGMPWRECGDAGDCPTVCSSLGATRSRRGCHSTAGTCCGRSDASRSSTTNGSSWGCRGRRKKGSSRFIKCSVPTSIT